MKKGMQCILSLLLVFMLCAGLFAVFGVNTVKAAEDDIASGTSGTCSWVIDKDGVLTISPIDGVVGYFDPGVLTTTGGALYPYKSQIKKVIVEKTVTVNSCSKLFNDLSSCVSYDLSGFDTSNVTSMYRMFYNNTALTSVLLSDNFNTEKVTDMRQMFYGCKNLVSLDISNLSTDEVRNMNQMFFNCYRLTSLDVSGFNTSNVSDMQEMFSGCSSLTALDVSSFNTSNVKNMKLMFYNCSKLTSLDVSKWDTSKVTTMRGLFSGCSGLTELNVNNFDTSNVTDMSSMFYKIPALKSLDLSSFDTSKVTDMSAMFWYSSGLKEINVAGWDTSNVINMANMFRSCGVEKIDCSSWNTAKVTNMNSMLGNACPVKSITFGPDFKFANLKDSAIPTPSGTIYTGKWISVTGDDNQYTTEQLYSHINSSTDTETWVWELKPCAVFSDDGTLSFIRPTVDSIYTSGSTGTVKSISGGEYTGRIFAVEEVGSGGRWWSSVASDVLSVKFIDEIKPAYPKDWFNGFSNCVEMDLKKLDTSNAVNLSYMFKNCSNLEMLDLSNFDTSKATDMSYMFERCGKIKTVKLGETFSFKGRTTATVNQPTLPTAPANSEYTQKWIRDDKAFGPYAASELRDNYTSEMAGTWIWELAPTEYTLSFSAGENGTGAMSSVNGPAKEDFILPANQFANFGYDFDHWDDGNGHTYADKGTIPANTYAADKKVTLTAVWRKRDTSVTMQDGTFTFDIKAGEKATFKDIPAGTSYQVYELTPDGWVLVQQENASGVIEALEESAAAFWNQYQPGVTTVQFSGLKTLDGHPASEGSYKFELLENGKVIDTATTQDGGFIQFKVIEYDAAGDHTYIIREVEPDDDSVDYDMHEETVMVSVIDDGAGNLSSEVTYDKDGIKFENHTRPGILRITKNADVTEANKDDTFIFEITFSNENGMPISDNIYWYVEN